MIDTHQPSINDTREASNFGACGYTAEYIPARHLRPCFGAQTPVAGNCARQPFSPKGRRKDIDRPVMDSNMPLYKDMLAHDRVSEMFAGCSELCPVVHERGCAESENIFHAEH